MSRHAISQWILTVSFCLAPCAMAEDVLSTTTGPSSNRVDVVFVGDGYQAGELDAYHEHLDGAIDYMFFGDEQPFNRYGNFFNFHRIEVISVESGADVPPEDIFVDTALGAKFYFDGVTERLLSINTNLANSIVNRSLSSAIDVDMRFAVINSTRYGGAGGSFATFAGGNPSAYEIGLHEVAHSFSNLADEYVSFDQPYSGGEPVNPNVTTDGSGAKWDRWLGYEQDGIGTIGVYEGALYHKFGVYRPSEDSKMRTLNRPFDAVSREQLVLDIYKHVDPMDSHLSTSSPLGFADEAWVDVVDPAIIDLTWSVNGQSIAHTGEQMSIDRFVELGIMPGVHQLSVEAVDNTDWIRLEDQRPRQTATWNVEYFPGDFNDDELIDAVDMDLLTASVLAGDNDLLFDLTKDALVDQADRDMWVAANQGLYGDLDLNREVEFADFLVLSSNFGTDANSWAHGNFDGLAGVGFGDFLLLSANFGKSSGTAAITSVPEPAFAGMLGLLMSSVLLATRRKRTK